MSCFRLGLRRWRAALAALLICIMPLAALGEEELTLNFVNADIEGVIKAVSQLTGKNFLVDPRVKGTINLISSQPIPKRLAYETLVSALRMQGFSVVENRGLTKVVLDADAKTQPGPVGASRGTDPTPASEQIVTRVIKLNYETAAQAVNVLRPLMNPNMAISTTLGSNMLIITDSSDNMNRLLNIISAIDVPTSLSPVIVYLQHIAASEAAAQLNKIFGGAAAQVPGAPARSGLVAVADSKSNRLILRSDDADTLRRAQTILLQIDKPESATGNIHVIPIRNADAVQLANTLRTILAGEGQPGSSGQSSPTPSQPIQNPSNSGGAGGSNIPSFGQTNTSGALQGGSTIQADVGSNSLIVIAPESVYQNLLQVIEKLDRRRAQVYLEVLIAEISSTRAAEMGFQWQALNGLTTGSNNKATVFGSTRYGDSTSNIGSVSANPNNLGNGLSFGVVKGQTTLPGVGTIANIGALARLLESDSQANILSAPNILTLDNEEAQIVIGQNVPFTTGSYTNSTSGATNPFQTYERKDVGLTLKVKPQITAGDVVMINIFQEVSSVLSSTANNVSGPTTNKRALQSKILVDDGNMIVLGGLIEDSSSNDDARVPVLGDVPLVGHLFRSNGRKRNKTNLMVFIRPTIVRDASTYSTTTASRYQDLAAKQADQIQNPAAWISEKDSPLLPRLPYNQTGINPVASPAYRAAYPAPAYPTGVTSSPALAAPTPQGQPLYNQPILLAPPTVAYPPSYSSPPLPNPTPSYPAAPYQTVPAAPVSSAYPPAQPTPILLASPQTAQPASNWQAPSAPRFGSQGSVVPKTYLGGRTIE